MEHESIHSGVTTLYWLTTTPSNTHPHPRLTNDTMALYNLVPLYINQSGLGIRFDPILHTLGVWTYKQTEWAVWDCLTQDNLRQFYVKKTDEWVHGEIRGAQLIAGVWSIVVNSQQARRHLLEKVRYINIHNHKAQLYDEYPTVVKRVPTEKVILKDLPFHVEGTDMFAYLHSQPDIQITTKHIIHVKLRNQKRELIPFLSGERFVYIKKLD